MLLPGFSCRKAALLISKELDDEISPRQRLYLRFHLLVCRVCTHLVRQLQFQKEAVGRLEAAEEEAQLAAPALSEEARRRIAQGLEQQGE